MPCAPDPIESNLSYNADQLAKSDKKFHELLDEIAACRKVIDKLSATVKLNEKAAELLAVARQTFAMPKLVSFDFSVIYSRDTQEVFNDMYSAINHNEQAVKEKENEVCLLRHALLKAVRSIESAEMSAQLKVEIDKEKKQHIAHRNDDRRTWIKWLEERLSLHQYYVDEGEEKDKKQSKEKIALIKAEIKRVKKLTAEEMLNDRDIFGRNCDVFDKSYDLD